MTRGAGALPRAAGRVATGAWWGTGEIGDRRDFYIYSYLPLTTSVQAKIRCGVHFSVWSLRPATTSVP